VDRAHEPLGLVLSRATPRRSSTTKATTDLELEAGARAHFEDPYYYSDTYDWRDEDAVYYRDVAKAHGRVLEHGIGNGRIALPMARAGVEVTGIDHTPAMLDHLRELLKGEPPAVRRRIELHQGDMRTKRLGKRFPLVICPFNAALHLYTRMDVEGWLARVREHLEPRGELVFDISMPIAKDLARNPKVPYRVPPFEHPTAGRVSYREHFDYDRVRQILFVSMFFEPAPKKRSASKARSTKKAAASSASKRAKQITEPFMTPLAQRQFYPQEMEALLHYNGFVVKELYGDFDRGPLVQASDVMVWHVTPRARREKGR
jgi:SAM-dependent methyltransferase